MMPPRATIVIPFTKDDAYLQQAIRSVIAQTFGDWELLLIDDRAGTHPASDLGILTDARIRLLADERNLGLPARLNQAAHLARGEYLFRMDSDDVMHPERVGRQIAALDENPDVDVLGTRAYMIDEVGAVIGLYGETELPVTLKDALRAVPFTHPTVAARTIWFRENPYDESFRLAQDKELWARVVSKATFAKLEQPLLFYRVPRAFSRSKYLATKQADRSILALHGARVTRGQRALLAVSIRAKGLVARTADALGATHWLWSRRARLLSEAEVRTAYATLRCAATPPQPDREASWARMRPATASGPRVLVAIPMFNAEAHLAEAVDSVLAQTYSNWELLLLDDGSTDRTLEIARSYADPRIRLVADGQNLGLGARLNQVPRLTEHELVFRMDSDDVMHPSRISEQVKDMGANPTLAVLASSAYVIDEHTVLRGGYREVSLAQQASDFFAGCSLSHPTIVGRREWFLDNPYDVELRRSEDLDLWIRTFAGPTFARSECPLLYYRVPRRVPVAMYRASRQADRAVLRKHRTSVGPLTRMTYPARSVMKEAVVAALHVLGEDHRVQDRRIRPLAEGEYWRAQSALQQALCGARGRA